MQENLEKDFWGRERSLKIQTLQENQLLSFQNSINNHTELYKIKYLQFFILLHFTV